MAVTTVLVFAKDEATSRYDTLSPRFVQLSGGVLFRLSDKSLDARKYFSIYWSALYVSTDTLRTALTVHRCSEIDWMNTALQYGFFVL